MDVVGFSLPSTSMQLEPRTIWVSMLVGTVVTVVAALVPARRATKVLPVEALREATPGAERPSVDAAVIGARPARVGVARHARRRCTATAAMSCFGLGRGRCIWSASSSSLPVAVASARLG